MEEVSPKVGSVMFALSDDEDEEANAGRKAEETALLATHAAKISARERSLLGQSLPGMR